MTRRAEGGSASSVPAGISAVDIVMSNANLVMFVIEVGSFFAPPPSEKEKEYDQEKERCHRRLRRESLITCARILITTSPITPPDDAPPLPAWL